MAHDLFRVCSGFVPGTRNSGNPRQYWFVPGVPGVPADAPACARVHFYFFHARTQIIFPRVRRRNTRNTRNKPLFMRLLAVPGTRNSVTYTRNSIQWPSH